MRIESPPIVVECPYCHKKVEDVILNREICPGRPPIDIDRWYKAKEEGRICHEDGTPLVEGEVIQAICPDCTKLGMPTKILGTEETTILEIKEAT